MANFFDWSAFTHKPGSAPRVSGLFNSCSLRPYPYGFELLLQQLIFRLRSLFPPTTLFPSPWVSCVNNLPSPFQESWSDSDVSELAKVARLLASSLQLCFPDVVLPTFPSFNHPSSLIHFLSSLILCFRHSLPSLSPVPYPHSQLPYILASLLKLVLFSHSPPSSEVGRSGEGYPRHPNQKIQLTPIHPVTSLQHNTHQ